jgi:hypothetical protein
MMDGCPICKGVLKLQKNNEQFGFCAHCDKGWNFNYNPPEIYYEGKRLGDPPRPREKHVL